MKLRNEIVVLGLLALVLITNMGCATTQMPQTGFLNTYLDLESDPEGKADWLYINETIDYRSYDKIMFDQVVFFFKEDAKYKGIAADEMSQLSEGFHKAIVEALSDGYTFVDQPGPNVLRIRIAITDLVPTKPVQNTISTIMPIGLVVSIVKRGVTGAHLGVSDVTIEGEILNSETNEQYAAMIDRETGKKYKIVKGATKWGLVDDAFNQWATNLRTRLDKFTGKK